MNTSAENGRGTREGDIPAASSPRAEVPPPEKVKEVRAKLLSEQTRNEERKQLVANAWRELGNAVERHLRGVPRSPLSGALDDEIAAARDRADHYCAAISQCLHDLADNAPDVQLSPDPGERRKARSDLKVIRRALLKATQRPAIKATQLPSWGGAGPWMYLRSSLANAVAVADELAKSLDKPARPGDPPKRATNRSRPNSRDDGVILSLQRCWFVVAGKLPGGLHDRHGVDRGEFQRWVKETTATLAPEVHKRLVSGQGTVYRALERLRSPNGGPLARPEEGATCDVEEEPEW